MTELFEGVTLAFLISALIKIVFFAFMVTLPMVAYSVYAERRVSAIMQDRVGPNRTGKAGLLQPLADGLKFFLKEDLTPNHVNKFYYWLAPMLTVVPALMTAAVIPFGSELDISWLASFGFSGEWLNKPVPMVIADLNVGPLFTFAIASIGVYGIVLAGWSSNSKYPFLGAVRSCSQVISYEIALGLSIIPIIMIFGELNLSRIAQYQDANGWLLLPLWGKGLSIERWVLLIPVVISFVIFMVSLFAETNRAPFDLPECETELVAGYHTEYSSMKFALFFMGEYAAMIIGSGLAVTLFLGGWSLPFGISSLQYKAGETPALVGLLHFASFIAKVVLIILFFIVVRWTLPRLRYDQLMDLGWKFFFELALANVILTAALLMFFRI